MSMTASAALPAAANPLARFTIGLFGLFRMSLTMLVLRLTLALPFWKSGLTKWDGWFTLSFGAQALFTDEFKLHILSRFRMVNQRIGFLRFAAAIDLQGVWHGGEVSGYSER